MTEQHTSSDVNAIVYTSTYCGYCKQLKSFLTDRGVTVHERNIDTDDKFAEELVGLGYSSVPVTVIGEEKVLGFNAIKLNRILEH
ncbi:glutaredoxin family protein [Gorillibacterium massiliense]|uniref:glutaredoxin family protein n=1 Tax=Gorillibacterium massiliense TaxID=1280390 RepID=UPI0004B78694|nr:glutaredoxin family protein [Gorillibacterium massiliense]